MGEQARHMAFESARLRLARVRSSTGQTREAGFRLIVRIVGEALDVERVGIWMFEDERRRLRCHTQFRLSDRTFVTQPDLLVEDFPRYFAALREHRALPADEARAHPVVRELGRQYLLPNDIYSLLDAPIIHEGEVVGVVCHEAVGRPRTWTQQEIDFAGTAADIAALILQQAERLELEAALKVQTEQRLEAQQLEAVGRMARAVAHDLNNLLTVVMAVGQEAGGNAHACATCAREAATLTATCDVGSRLVSRLSELGGHQHQEQARVAVPAVLQEMATTLRTLVGRDVGISLDSSAARTVAALPRGELEQVLLNLVVNARDAIRARAAREPGRVTPDGLLGHIAVRLRDGLPEDGLQVDDMVLEVRDDGEGMSEQTLAHLFEPYYTTKALGTGLGLAIVYGIVKRAGGALQVMSAPGEGATFLIGLRAVPGATAGAQ